jgi:hypothetical protein
MREKSADEPKDFRFPTVLTTPGSGLESSEISIQQAVKARQSRVQE